MTPRAYSLGRRAASATATRQRVIDAAAEQYFEHGFEATTLKSIADRADVSRGTILHHFGSADGLLEAVAETVLDRLEFPDERLLDGIEDPERRIRAFVDEMVRFFKRSTPWWTVFASEMQRPALQAREAEYWASLGRLQAAAFGPDLARDRVTSAAVNGLLHPGTLGAYVWALESSGLNLEEVIGVVGDLVIQLVKRGHVAPARSDRG